MRVLVTRPQRQADEWVERLRATGVDAHALPLIEIGPAPDAQAVRDAWRNLGTQALVVFVSPNAVERFFGAQPGAVWPEGAIVGATGPGTSAALRAAGVPAALLVEPDVAAGRFDSEALWARLVSRRDWRGAQVLVVRGEDGRDWLAQTLGEAGATVRFVEAYRRTVPRLSPAQRALLEGALAQPAAHLWLLSSSEAVGHLMTLAPGASWQHTRAIASHPRIAARAREAGFGEVLLVPAELQRLTEAIASIQSPAP
jgi:uroporphyrinogen-III synthase